MIDENTHILISFPLSFPLSSPSYQFYTELSGTTFFNSLCLMSYNVIFTGLPVMGFVFDKDLSEATVMANPFLYRDSQSGR